MGHGVGRAHAELYRQQAEALELENAGNVFSQNFLIVGVFFLFCHFRFILS